MGSLRRAVTVAGVTGGLLYLFGFPGWISFGICVVAFLSTGGVVYAKIVVKTLPRDLWFVLKLVTLSGSG